MRDYLLDTNIWAYLFDPNKYPDQHVNIQKRLEDLTSSVRFSISVISWGEIAVGLPGSTQSRHLKFIKALKPSVIGVDTHIAEEYGKLRGLLSGVEPKQKREKNLHHEELVDSYTWLELGSLENDLWIAAQAMSRNLTLVTNDKLHRISEVVGNELYIENWAVQN